MSDQLSELQAILKNCLSTLEEPIVFRNMLQQSDGSYEWQLLRWNLSELVAIFGNKVLPFRIGDHNKRTVGYNNYIYFFIILLKAIARKKILIVTVNKGY